MIGQEIDRLLMATLDRRLVQPLVFVLHLFRPAAGSDRKLPVPNRVFGEHVDKAKEPGRLT